MQNGEPHIAREGNLAYVNGEYLKAMELLLPFAEAGDVLAQCNVGSMYHLGLGISANAALAEYWYLKAGERGCPLAYHNLATMYLVEQPGVEGKKHLAAEYGRKAVALGFDLVPKDYWRD